ncbi:AN1-type zinc finger protein 1-like [Haliotis asinina]|uniref:AN1-type zinc finger protein 1-like n=1 Tax=Haliotis asinina TaxID=109174 RepID=UPI0035320213
MAEFPNIGKQCSVDTCKQLDFLPFECDGCEKIYCLLHRTKDGHNCSRSCVKDNTVEYTGEKGFTCMLENCHKRELTPVLCPHCSQSFCLSHRHQQDHQCEKLDLSVKVSKTAEHVKQILESKKGKIGPPKHRGSKNPKMAAKVALMKLKQHAVGEKGIPESEKIHLSVQLPASQTHKAMYFSKKWTIGRMIDFAASTAGITNLNNTGAEKKLRLFVSDSGALLPVEVSLETLLDGEVKLYNGSSVMLENVTSDCQNIYDLHS